MERKFVEGLHLRFKSNELILKKYEKINHFDVMPIRDLDGYCEANAMCVKLDTSGRSTRGNVVFEEDKKRWREL